MFQEYPKKRAFITGGASGLGKAFASLLLTEGWTLGIADINPTHITETIASWEHFQNKVFSYPIDVTQSKDLQHVAEEFAEKLGGVDIVINCAGVAAGGEFELFSLTDFNRVLDVNFKGVLYSCKAFVPILLKQQSGLIINVASAAAFASAPLMSSYNVSKAAVSSLTETLQAEYSKKGVRFALVMPTFFRSDLHNNIIGVGESLQSAYNLLTEAKIDADWVAQKAFKKIDRGQFYIVLPTDAKIVWFVKRHFPKFYLKIIGPLTELRRKK